jgi:hypothetical protein
MDRARRVLGSAQRIVLADAPGMLAEKLAGEIEQARARGTRVLMIAGGRVDPPRLRMVADGREALLAELSPDGVRDALWTQSTIFAVTIHDALTTELFFLEVGRGVSEGLSVDEVEQAFERCREIRDGIGA